MERKATAASAEAEILEAAIEEEEKQSCKDENIPVTCYSPAERTSEYVQGLAHVQSSQESLVTGHLDGLNDTSESKIPLTACSGPFAADFVHTEPNFQPLKNTQLIQDHIPFSSDIELEPKKSGPILKQYWKPQSIPVLNTASNKKWIEESYGAPQAIDGALFKRIDEFPKISNR